MMSSTEQRLEALDHLKSFLQQGGDELEATLKQAYQRNKWFTEDNVRLMLQNITGQFLDEAKLRRWLERYPLNKNISAKTIGLVMAGNIPLVGFHDFLCVFVTGHRALIKLSSKDDVLIPMLLKKIYERDAAFRQQVTITETLKGMDAAIATGSNNSSRYFQLYFDKYPHIIRKNRGSAAVLTGDETAAELEQLCFDVFSYFGMGCRNVSKLFVPQGYSFDPFFLASLKYAAVTLHNKYKNNYDYCRAVLLMNRIPFLTNEILIVKEDAQVGSPVAMLHYETYTDKKDLSEKLVRDAGDLQCIAGKGFLPFGTTQSPELNDYADDVDTMQFLASLT